MQSMCIIQSTNDNTQLIRHAITEEIPFVSYASEICSCVDIKWGRVYFYILKQKKKNGERKGDAGLCALRTNHFFPTLLREIYLYNNWCAMLWCAVITAFPQQKRHSPLFSLLFRTIALDKRKWIGIDQETNWNDCVIHFWSIFANASS